MNDVIHPPDQKFLSQWTAWDETTQTKKKKNQLVIIWVFLILLCAWAWITLNGLYDAQAQLW